MQKVEPPASCNPLSLYPSIHFFFSVALTFLRLYSSGSARAWEGPLLVLGVALVDLYLYLYWLVGGFGIGIWI